MSYMSPHFRPEPPPRDPVTSAERLEEADGQIRRLRWVLDASLRAGCPEEVDPRDPADLGSWLAGRPPLPSLLDELSMILSRGRAAAPVPREAWVPCTGPVRVTRRRWVEVRLEAPVRAVG